MDSDGDRDNYIGIWCVICTLLCFLSVNFPLPHVYIISLSISNMSKEDGLNAFAKVMMMDNFALTHKKTLIADCQCFVKMVHPLNYYPRS